LNGSDKWVNQEFGWIGKCLSQVLSDEDTWRSRLHIDMAPIAYAALRMHELGAITQQYQQRAFEMAERFMQSEGADDGTIPYTPGSNLILVDTVGFLCPLLARVGRIRRDSTYTRLAIRQIDSFILHATDSASGWVSHAFDRQTRSRLGQVGWGRGMGWLVLGITDTLLELEDYSERQRLGEIANHMFEKLARVQREDGHWSWNLMMPHDEADSSLTTLIAYALARLINNIPHQFDHHNTMLQRCRLAIDRATSDNGHVGQASGEAGGVGTYSMQFGNHLWALGPAVAVDFISAS
jgi:unsaturated rhamnogalacturonyl hydrolase